MADQDPHPDKPDDKHKPSFQIQIDRTHYTVHAEKMTGKELRQVPTPPIAEDRDLYEVRPGEDDEPIKDTDVVKIRDGLRFFTAPRHINPGNEV